MLNNGNFVPVSKLLDHQWNNIQYSKHKERLQAIKTSQHNVDNTYPKQFTHLTLRLKKHQLEEDKHIQIEQRNRKLVENINKIIENPSTRVDHWNEYESSTLQIVQKSSLRKKQHENISKDNQVLSNKLISVKSTYNVNDWEREFRRHRKIKDMLERSTKNYNYYNQKQNFYDLDFDDMDRESPSKNRFISSPMPSSVGSSSDDKTWRTNAKQLKTAPKIQQCETDARMLMKACNHMDATHINSYNKRRQCNEILIKTLVKRSPKQRQQIRIKFKSLYEAELETKLKDSLGKDYYGVIEGLLQNPYTQRITSLHQAVKDVDAFAIMDLLICFDKASLSAIEQVYQKHYSSSIDSDVADFFGDEDVRNIVLAFKNGIKCSLEQDKIKTDLKAKQLSESEKLLNSKGILLQELCKSPQRFVDVCQAYDNQQNDNVASIIKKQYDSSTYALFRHLCDNVIKQLHIEKLVASLDSQISNCNKQLIQELILLNESPNTFHAVNNLFTKQKGTSLHDLIINRCRSDSVPVVAAITNQLTQRNHKKSI